MRYRLGRSHSDTIYRQLGESPSEDDPRVAVFWEVIDAIRVVRLLNGDDAGSAPPDSQATVNPKLTDAHAPAREVAHASDVVDAIMDTIDAYPAGTGPERAPRTRAHVERLIREYAASERAAGVEEGRRAAGEVVSVPPSSDPLDCPDCYGIAHDEMDERDCCDAHTDEPPVVPPPVDALLTEDLTDEALANVQHWHAIVHPDMADRGVYEPTRNPSGCDRVFCLTIVTECAAVAAPRWWATGVEEGRRQMRELTDMMVTNVIVDQTGAAEVLREHFHPDGEEPLMGHVRSADGECWMCTDLLAAARRAHAESYDLGLTEGRRQATEERTEEQSVGERLAAVESELRRRADYEEEMQERADG